MFVQRVEFGYRPNLLPLRQRHRTERVGRPEVLPSGGGWREIPATPHLLFSQFMGESGDVHGSGLLSKCEAIWIDTILNKSISDSPSEDQLT